MTDQTAVRLPRSGPRAQGVDVTSISAFLDAVEANIREIHSVMLLRHGVVVAEGWWNPYRPDAPHMLFSLSKSFTSTAAGFAIADGLVSLDDPVLPFFPEDAPDAPSDNLRAMRVRHLLSMSSGHSEDTLGSMFGDPSRTWARGFLSQPIEHVPGTHFVYNSGATYMISAILQRVTGQRLLDYLTPRLFEPLGIEGATWEKSPQGIDTGGWGLSIKTEDIARFGQLYLQDGIWNGERLLPEGWVAEATRSHISNGDDPESDWNQGYGFQFWRCKHGAYRGDGAFGQFCVVMPDQDAVLAITSGTGDMQAVLNLVWKHLLPGMAGGTAGMTAAAQSVVTDEASSGKAGALEVHAEDSEEHALRERLSRLALQVPEGRASAAAVSEANGRTYRFERNESNSETVHFEFGTDTAVLDFRDSRGAHKLECGLRGVWVRGETAMDGTPGQKIASSGAWTDDATFTIKMVFTEKPFVATLTFAFTSHEVRYDFRMNHAFGPTERPQLIGRSIS